MGAPPGSPSFVRSRVGYGVLLCALAATVAACGGGPSCGAYDSILGPGGQIVTASEVDFHPPTQGLDGTFASIEETVPSFAGFFYGPGPEGGTVIVEVADPADSAAAKDAIRPYHDGAYLIVNPDGTLRDPGVLVVRYSFLQLARWKVVAEANLTGITSMDIDERANVLSIGIRRGECVGPAREVMKEAGVPEDAVEVHQENPAQLTREFDDRTRAHASSWRSSPTSAVWRLPLHGERRGSLPEVRRDQVTPGGPSEASAGGRVRL